MAMLGDILAAARDGAGQFAIWLEGADPDLAGKVEAAAGQEGISLTAYVRRALADFSRLASEEDWATLTSNLKRTDDPGTICLLAIVDWRLTAPTCGQHSRDQAIQQGAADDRSEQRPARRSAAQPSPEEHDRNGL
jgi:hypothetical protein